MPAVATVSNAVGSIGVATALKAGSTSISATVSGVTGASTLTVTPAVLSSIAVGPTNPSVPNGNNQPLTATGTFSDGSTQDLTDTVTWDTSMPAVASVSNAQGSAGLAHGLSLGQTTISATVNSISGSTTLTVSDAVLVSIAVKPPNKSIALGISRQFSATGTYSDNATARSDGVGDVGFDGARHREREQRHRQQGPGHVGEPGDGDDLLGVARATSAARRA